jgi:hypothetical protein
MSADIGPVRAGSDNVSMADLLTPCADERFTRAFVYDWLAGTTEDVEDLGEGDDWKPVTDGLFLVMQEQVAIRLPPTAAWDPDTGTVTGYTDVDVLKEIVFEDAFHATTDNPDAWSQVASSALGRPIRVGWQAEAGEGRWVRLHDEMLYYPMDEITVSGIRPGDSQQDPRRPTSADPGVVGYTHWAYFPTAAFAALAAYRFALYFDCLTVLDEPDASAEPSRRVRLRASRPVRIGTLKFAHDEAAYVVRRCGGIYDGGETGYLPA